MRYFHITILTEDKEGLISDEYRNKSLHYSGYYSTELTFEEIFYDLGHIDHNGFSGVLEYTSITMVVVSSQYAEIECKSKFMPPAWFVRNKHFRKVKKSEVPIKKEDALFYVVVNDHEFKNVDGKKNKISEVITGSSPRKETYSYEGGLSHGEIQWLIDVSKEFIGYLGQLDGAVGGLEKVGVVYLLLKGILKKKKIRVKLPKRAKDKILKKLDRSFNDKCEVKDRLCTLDKDGIISCVCYSISGNNEYEVLYNCVEDKIVSLKIIK